MSVVFISHSSRDGRAAEALRDRLVSRGYAAEGSIFLDSDLRGGIRAGQAWEQTLYRSIRASRAVIVLCSRSSMESRWCFMEITHARALGKHLFPVRLDDCSLDGILSEHQAVDLSSNPEAGYESLFLGLEAAGLDPRNVFIWDGRRPPYPGLLAFDEADAAMFVGRDDEIADGLDCLNRVRRLNEARFVLVLGPSGSGKSSFVRAGIVPRLRRDSARWLVVGPFRPHGDPVPELVESLYHAFESVGVPRSRAQSVAALAAVAVPTAVAGSPANALEPTPDRQELAAALDRLDLSLTGSDLEAVRRHLRLARLSLTHLGSARPAEYLERTDALAAVMDDLRRASRRDGATVVLVIDQFEELLDRPPDHPAHGFLGQLAAAVRPSDSPLLVLATMRSDFLGRFQTTAELAGVAYETVLVAPLRNVGSVIVEPARSAGIELEPGLTEALVADAQTEDALPLLAFTLRELYDRGGQRQREMTLADYRALGGLEGAVARTAGELVMSASPRELELLRVALLRMARISDDGAYVRRTAFWRDIEPDAYPILERFVAARLLTSGERSGERTLEVAHEALFRSWDRLKGWLEDGAEALRIQRDLATVIADWQRSEHAGEYLWRGGRLARAVEVARLDGWQLSALERGFLDASMAVEHAERQREETRRRRQLRAALAVAATIGVLLVGTVWLYRNAMQQRDQALGRQLASSAADVWNTTSNGTLAALLAIESLTRIRTAEGFEALWRVNRDMAREVAWADHAQKVRAVAFSPDGKLVASGSDDKTIRVFEAATGRERMRKELDGAVRAVVFSSDGALVAAAAVAAHAFDVNTGDSVLRPDGQRFSDGRPALAVAFQADGRSLTAMANDHVAVFRLRSPEDALVSDTPIEEDSRAIALSPDGKYILTETTLGQVQEPLVRDARTGATIFPLKGLRSLQMARFSRDSRLVLAAGSDTVAVFEVPTGSLLSTTTRMSDTIVDLSPSGALVVRVRDHTSVSLQRWRDGRDSPPIALSAGFTALAVSPDDTLLAAASSDWRAGVYDVASGKQISRIETIGGISDLTFNATGSIVAAASALTSGDVPGGAGVYATGTGRDVRRVAHAAEVTRVAVTPDGRFMAVASEETITLFADAGEPRRIDWRRDEKLVAEKLRMTSLALSDDGTWLAVAAVNQGTGTFEVAEGRRQKAFALVFDTRTSQLRASVEDSALQPQFDVQPFTVAFSPDGRRLAVGANQRTFLVETHTGRDLGQRKHPWDARAVAFTRDGATLAVLVSTAVHLFDVEKPGEPETLQQPFPLPDGMAFAAAGDLLAVASGSETVVLRRDGGQVSRLRQEEDDLSALTMSDTGALVAIGSRRDRTDEPGVVHVFETRSGQEIGRLTTTEPIWHLRFGSDGRLFIWTGTRDLSLTTDVVEPAALAAEACTKLHRNLSEDEWANYVRVSRRTRTCPQHP